MAEGSKRIEGGCFCGKVRYEVEPDYVTYRYCFCSRCRKTRGTNHASNVFAKPEGFRWLSGEAFIKRFDLEGARFGNCFCSECGSPVPRLVTGGKAVLIPAGSFDTDPGVRPEGAIFWDSRAEWMPNVDTLEKKAEY